MDISEWQNNPVVKIAIWLTLGLTGGIVHTCENNEHFTLKKNIGSLITSAFAGMIGGMLLHNVFTDPMILGGACAMMGYTGQLTLVILRKRIKNILAGYGGRDGRSE